MSELISLFLVVLISVFLGLFTYKNNPKSATSRSFTLLTFSLAFWAIVMYLSNRPFPPDQVLWLIRLSMFAAITMSTSILLFSLTVPRTIFPYTKKILYLILFLSLISLLVSISPFMFTHITYENGSIVPHAGWGMVFFLVTGVGYILASIFILFIKFFKSKDLVRTQLRIILTGLILMHILLIIGVLFFSVILGSDDLVSYAPVFSIPFLASSTYAITRHRFLKIRAIVARTVAFTILLLAIVGFLATLLTTLPLFLPAQFHSLATITSSIILAFSFNPLRLVLERLTEKVFHKRSYNPNELLEELSEIIRSTLNINRLTTKVNQTLVSTIAPSQSAFLLLGRDQKQVFVFQNNFDTKPETTVEEIIHLTKKAKQSILVLDETESKKTKEILEKYGFSVVVPLVVSTKIHGLFVLGPKASGEIYNAEDLKVLEIFGPQISVAIQNSLAFEEIANFNLTLRDKVKDATSELRKANRDLRKLDKLKDEFVFIATHELKTPVTVIKGYISMIEDGTYGKLPKALNEPCHEITEATSQLVQLVNDLLQIARSEAKTISIDTKPVDLCQIIQETVTSLKPLADQKKLGLTSECDDEIIVMADPDRLKEIINNLVSNAIKYSEAGKISLWYAQENNQIITHVTDEGAGIAAEDQKRIFTRFFRSEELSGKAPGTGLGLFIVKQLVERMKGRIWFTSKPGSGTTFSFALPKAEK